MFLHVCFLQYILLTAVLARSTMLMQRSHALGRMVLLHTPC